MRVPERVRWAVRFLAVQPEDRLLEIGCGGGTAVAVICDQLVGGTITAIDRSAAKVSLARRRNHDHIAAGRAVLHCAPLDLARLDGQRFDKIFAVNVNLFWVRSAERELDIVRQSLAVDGQLFLFYEMPHATRAVATAQRVSAFLTERGFTTHTRTGAPKPSTAMVCLSARPDRQRAWADHRLEEK